jgi:hypothetical protein
VSFQTRRQVARKYRDDRLLQQAFGPQALPFAHAPSDRDIDVLAGEVAYPRRGNQIKFDLRVLEVNIRHARQ